MFKKKKHSVEDDPVEDPVGVRFDKMMELIKGLSRSDFNRLIKAMELGWKSYDVVRNVKTDEERDSEEINESDKKLTKLEYME